MWAVGPSGAMAHNRGSEGGRSHQATMDHQPVPRLLVSAAPRAVGTEAMAQNLL